MLLLGLKVVAETVELKVPERPRVIQPAVHGVERSHVQLAALHPAALHRCDKPRRLQHAKVFQDGRHGHVERLGQLRDGRLAAREPGKNRAARRVGERAEHGVEPVL